MLLRNDPRNRPLQAALQFPEQIGVPKAAENLLKKKEASFREMNQKKEAERLPRLLRLHEVGFQERERRRSGADSAKQR